MPKLHREVRNATAGKPGILAYLSLGLLMVVLTLVRLCRRRRKFSAKQLDAYHDWKKGTAEGKLESKLARMQQKLEGMRSRRKVEEGRDAHERLLKKAEELREVRGREVYGDDWDDPKDGVPIRDLFALSDVEVRTLQTEARNARAVDAERALDGAERGTAKPKKPPPHARDRVGNILSVPMRVTMTTSSADAFAFDEAMQADCLQNASSKEWFQKRHAFSDYVEALAKNPQFKKGAIKKE